MRCAEGNRPEELTSGSSAAAGRLHSHTSEHWDDVFRYANFVAGGGRSRDEILEISESWRV